MARTSDTFHDCHQESVVPQHVSDSNHPLSQHSGVFPYHLPVLLPSDSSTTNTVSSPMGLGSDSEPVFVNILGQDVYLADSMQFVLEYFLRFQENLPGTYYISTSFRGEDPDATHLYKFYHVECELLGDMDKAIQITGLCASPHQCHVKK